MEELRRELDDPVAALPNAEAFRSKLETLVSVYPFNEYEYIIAALLAAGKLTHDEYVELGDAYIARNLFLYILEIGAIRQTRFCDSRRLRETADVADSLRISDG